MFNELAGDKKGARLDKIRQNSPWHVIDPHLRQICPVQHTTLAERISFSV